MFSVAMSFSQNTGPGLAREVEILLPFRIFLEMTVAFAAEDRVVDETMRIRIPQ